MQYINESSGKYPYTLADFKLDNPQLSLRIAPSDETLIRHGIYPVAETPQPAYDPLIQTVQESLPVVTASGKYEQAWEVVPRFDDYTDKDGVLHTRAEQEAEALAARALAAAKAARQVEVDAIKVTTTAGHTFDGDERSQDRMGTTLAAMDDGDTGPWVLADNTVIQVTKAELREALRLARSAMAEIWVRPYL